MKIKEFYTDKSKWVQRLFHHRSGACCLVGAMQKCYPVDPVNPGSVGKRLEVESKLRVGIVARTKNGKDYLVGSLTHWNDAPERTFEDVKALVEELDV